MSLNQHQWDSIWGMFLELWPDWEPKPAEQTIWHSTLSRYPLDLFDAARIEHYKVRQRYKRPDLDLFEKTLKQLWAKRINLNKQSTSTTEVAWLCYKQDDRGRGQIGRMMQFVCADSKLPTTEQTTYRCGEYTETLGGRFLYISGYREIRAKRYEVLHEAGLCRSYCPLCDYEANPDKAKAIDEAAENQDLTALAKLLFGDKSVISPAKATVIERQKQEKDLAVAVLPAKKEPENLYEAVAEKREEAKKPFDPNRLFRAAKDNIPF